MLTVEIDMPKELTVNFSPRVLKTAGFNRF